MSSIVAAYDKTLYYNEAGKYCVLRLKTADPNLCVIIDHNGLQIDGPNEKVMGRVPFRISCTLLGWRQFKLAATTSAQWREPLKLPDKPKAAHVQS